MTAWLRRWLGVEESGEVYDDLRAEIVRFAFVQVKMQRDLERVKQDLDRMRAQQKAVS
jgi:hypothetical protein